MKRLARVFDLLPEAARILRELKFLRLLGGHENIISIRSVLLPDDRFVHRRKNNQGPTASPSLLSERRLVLIFATEARVEFDRGSFWGLYVFGFPCLLFDNLCRDKFNEIFVVFELMPTDLNRLLRSTVSLSAEHVRWLTYQIVRALYYLHSSHIFHRDLKPSNLLVNADCDLRLCDFGKRPK